MAQSKQQIQATLSAAGMQPRHRFGQNFMIDQNLVRTIADAAAIEPTDTIIEVGPGTGTLTEELLARAGRVIAVEIDHDLAGALRQTFADRETFTLIEGDALNGKHALNVELQSQIDAARESSWHGFSTRDPSEETRVENPCHDNAAARSALKLVANLPYNIASPLVVELLLAGVSTIVFTVQKEVAERMKGGPGQSDYGPLTVMVQLLSRVEVLRTLPPQAFWPPPKIDSALVRLTRDDRLADQARAFGAFVHKVFSFRRKTLRKALDMSGYEVPLETLGLTGAGRAEELSPEQFLEMFRHARLIPD